MNNKANLVLGVPKQLEELAITVTKEKPLDLNQLTVSINDCKSLANIKKLVVTTPPNCFCEQTRLYIFESEKLKNSIIRINNTQKNYGKELV